MPFIVCDILAMRNSCRLTLCSFDFLCFVLSGCWTRLLQIAAIACGYCCLSGLWLKLLLCCYRVTRKTTSLQSSFLDKQTASMKAAEKKRKEERRRKEYAKQVQEEIKAYARTAAKVHARPLPSPPPSLPPRDYASHYP